MYYLNIIPEKDCTGCGACWNKCPTDAIAIGHNEEGFYLPYLDKEKCVNCGLCKKVCPQLNKVISNTKTPECYAVMADDKLRMKSSSGGIFSLFAEYILSNGGYVCGACYDKKNWFVTHIIINKTDDLKKLRKSKYVQSNTGNCFKEIEYLLKNGKPVLFSGTPCQVAGLKTFLMKDYPNLLSIDLICHGVPSPKVFDEFLKSLSDKSNITNIDFREKEVFGWATSTVVEFDNKKTYRKLAKNCFYTSAFQKSLFLNKPCANCKFSTIPRKGDITLGDFWGVNKYDPKLNDGLGIGVVAINNPKAEKIFNQVNIELKMIKKVPLEFIVDISNPNINGNIAKHKNREIFFNYLKNNTPIKEAVIKSLYYEELANIPKFLNKKTYYNIMYNYYRIVKNFLPKKLKNKYTEKKYIYKSGLDNLCT